jgi:excinuclease ABC subunit C
MLMKDKVQEIINIIPEKPGIYKMLDAKGNIIYIGKSKCLKKRVKSYFVKSHKWEKINKLVQFINSIEYIVTDTHLEARLLECQLIKEIKPYFNSQMKQDKRYIYINILDYNQYNSLGISLERMNTSYGPFRSKSMVENLINELKIFYPINKNNGQYEFDYHIFPVTMDKETFDTNKLVLEDIFQNTDSLACFKEKFECRMALAAAELRFETAGKYRDIISSLGYISYGLEGYKSLKKDKIVVTIPMEDGYKLFYVHNGYILNKKVYKRITKSSIESFIRQSERITMDYPYGEDEKAGKDFIDIIYSEILSLPEDMVYICS